MTSLERTSYLDPRAVELRHSMDVEMMARYDMGSLPAEVMAEYEKAFAIDPATMVATLVAVSDGGAPIGHAALRDLDGEWEVKRVIVTPEARGEGVGRALMAEVEKIAREGGAKRLILQTGDKQPEAVSLYENLGFTPIPVYEPYAGPMPESLCYEKLLA